MSETLTHRIEQTETALRHWLVAQAESGMPELVLVALLRAHASEIEATGCLPRTWASDTQQDARSPVAEVNLPDR